MVRVSIRSLALALLLSYTAAHPTPSSVVDINTPDKGDPGSSVDVSSPLSAGNAGDATSDLHGMPGMIKSVMARMTNGQRLARGLKPLPPTKKSTALRPRASSSTDTTNTFSTGPTYLLRVRPSNGNDLGTICGPFSGDTSGLLTFDADTSRAVRFEFGKGNTITGEEPGDGVPFEIVPIAGGDTDANALGQTLGTFGPGTLVGAIPGHGSGRDLAPGSANYANLGWATQDATTGLLSLDIPIDLVLPVGSQTSGSGDTASSLPVGGLVVDSLTGTGTGTGTGTSTSNSPLSGITADVSTVLGGSGLGVLGALAGNAQGSSPVGGLVNTVSTVNSGSGVLGNLPGPVQSPIMTLQNQQLLAHYLNSDGSLVPTSFVTGGPGCHHTICLTADVDLFRQANGHDAVQVTLLALVDV